MEEIKLSDDVIQQIKDFNRYNLTEEQNSLIDKLILNEKLRDRYRYYGLCEKCKQPTTFNSWCQSCNSKHFQQKFKNWTSGNHDVDEFIKGAQLEAENNREVLEWIEYDRFENVEYLAKGGFGTTYKAEWKDGYIERFDFENNQWIRYKERSRYHPVVLKSLHNSQDITAEFLGEIKSHVVTKSQYVPCCYGITKDPETNDLIMVIEFAENGNLRQLLNNRFNSMNWDKKLSILHRITYGIYDIHEKGLIHRDFHCGNILNGRNNYTFITDLGLCQPVNTKPSQKTIYGVLPYVAPEVLRGKKYTQESDIYGFGIVAHEVCTGLPPYHDVAHEEFLAVRICQGLRPNSNYKIPQLILDLIKQCWDADPSKRPTAVELKELCSDLYYSSDKENSIIKKQIDEENEINEKSISSIALTSTLSYTTHPQAAYTSRLLDFNELPEPKNCNDDNDGDDSFGMGFSGSVKIDFTELNED